MKTPIQELIEQFEELRSPAPIDSTVDVECAISIMKSMLKKEKIVMCEFAVDWFINCPVGQDITSVEHAKNYLDETFNTKEK